MANYQSKQVAQRVPALTPTEASCPVAVVAEYVTKTGDAIGDIVEMGAIPAGTVVVDLIVNNGALGASATLDAGILSGSYGDSGTRTMGNEFFAAKAAATAGLIRMDKNTGGIATNASDKSWGIKFLGANPAAGQTIRATLIVAPAPVGVA